MISRVTSTSALLGSLLLTAGVAYAAGQSDGAAPGTQTDSRAVLQSQTQTGQPSRADAKFLESAAEVGLAEVDASKLAIGKGTNAQVKAFAQQLAEDHGKNNDELTALASSKGVDLPKNPSIAQQAKEKVLALRDGAGFDKQYIDSFGVTAHEDAVKLFQKASTESNDVDIKAYAARTLPVLQQRLQQALDLQASLKTNNKK